MTSNDPNSSGSRRIANLRRESGSRNVWPLVFGFGILAMLGLMMLTDRDAATPARQTSIEQTNPTNSPGTTVNPTPAPSKN